MKQDYMKKIELPSGEYLLVEVPERAESGAEIRGEHSQRPYQILSFYGDADAIDLPLGQWSIIGKASELKEEDWKGIVESWDDATKYMDYKYISDHGETYYPFTSSTESGLSLLAAHLFKPSGTLILKLIKP